MARLTLNGMYIYEPTLFDGMILPEDYDRDALFAEIMTRCGQMYPYHQIPSILKSNIRLWFSRNFLQFDRVMEALNAEYNPVENYDKHEDWTRTPDLTDESTHTGKDSTQLSGTDSTELSGDDSTTRSYDDYNETSTRTGDDTTERQVSAYDSGTYQNAEKMVETFGSIADSKDITGSYEDKTDYGKKEDFTYGKKEDLTYGSTVTDRHTGTEEYTNYTHGNIGVRSAQELITQSIELAKYDVYVDIAERFEREFLVQVY